MKQRADNFPPDYIWEIQREYGSHPKLEQKFSYILFMLTYCVTKQLKKRNISARYRDAEQLRSLLLGEKGKYGRGRSRWDLL